MDPVTLAALAGLALVDSTSLGTLVLPLLLLLAPRVDVRRYAAYLAVVGGLYAALGVALVLGAGALRDVVLDLGDVTWLRWVQLVVGVVLLAAGAVGDKVLAWWRRRPGHAERASGGPREGADRAGTWAERLVGPDASYRAVVGVALAAVLVEVASMLPFLAAVGLITAADLPVVGTVGIVAAYAVVMVAPALLLLGVRLALRDRVEAPLARLAAWLRRVTDGAVYWVLAVVGLLVAGDAAGALGLT
ncbi:GAP family protein [Nocardioides zeae]